MSDQSFCRIGVFYDGSYFSYAQKHFYHSRKLGWLDLRQFHALLESVVRSKEEDAVSYKVVYAAWFQGLQAAAQSDEKKLHRDRNQHHDLMHAGVEMKFLPVSAGPSEKGVGVSLAVDALQVANDGKVDVAVLVTGDGDMVPLVRALMKKGVRVLVAYFDYDDGKDRGFANERLLAASNYDVNVNQLENDGEFKAAFKSLFRSAAQSPVERSADR